MVKQKKTILGVLLCALLTVCVIMGLVNLNSNTTAYAYGGGCTVYIAFDNELGHVAVDGADKTDSPVEITLPNAHGTLKVTNNGDSITIEDDMSNSKTVSAIPEEGCTFKGWKVNDDDISTTVNNHDTITAVFEEEQQLSTILDVLNTNPDFPKSDSAFGAPEDVFAIDSWVNDNGVKLCSFPNQNNKIRMGGFGIYGTDSINVTKISDSEYVYSSGSIWKVTFNLTDGVLSSITLSDYSITSMNGTYKPLDWLINEGDNHVWYKVTDLGGNNYGLVIGGEGAIPDFDSADDRPYDEFTKEPNSITSLTIQEGVTVLSSHVFYNFNIETVTIPASVKELHDSCFMHCGYLEEIIFAEGSNLETISGESNFLDASITSFTFPASVKTISAMGLFANCVNLEEITFLSTPETISEYAFYPLGYDMGIILSQEQYDELTPEEKAEYFEPISGAGYMKKLKTFVKINFPEDWTKNTIAEDGTFYGGLFSNGNSKPDSKPANNGLSTGAIIGIVIGAVVVVGIIVFVVVKVSKKKKKND